jgi:hypothetical protein
MTAEQVKENKAISNENKILLDILLKKANVKQKELVDFLTQEWIVSHLNLLSASEKKQFKHIIL